MANRYDVIKEARIGQQAIASSEGSIKTNWACDTMKMEIPWYFLTQRILCRAKRKTFYGPQINLSADIHPLDAILSWLYFCYGEGARPCRASRGKYRRARGPSSRQRYLRLLRCPERAGKSIGRAVAAYGNLAHQLVISVLVFLMPI